MIWNLALGMIMPTRLLLEVGTMVRGAVMRCGVRRGTRRISRVLTNGETKKGLTIHGGGIVFEWVALQRHPLYLHRHPPDR